MKYYWIIALLFITGCCCGEEDPQGDGLGAYPPPVYPNDEAEDLEPQEIDNPCTGKSKKTYANVSISMTELSNGQTEYTCTYSVLSCDRSRVDFRLALEGDNPPLGWSPTPHYALLNQTAASGSKTWVTFGNYDACYLYHSDGTVGTKPKSGGGSAPACSDNTDCATGYVCEENSCIKSCTDDSDCSGAYCVGSVCTPPSEIDESCVNDSDCTTFDTCIDGNCYKSCSTHDQCAGDMFCLDCSAESVCASLNTNGCARCELVSAEFSSHDVSPDDTVEISISGEGDCNGEDVSVEIYRSCEGEDEDESFVDTISTTFSDTHATVSWTVQDPAACQGQQLSGLVRMYGYQEVRDVDGYLTLS
ncbi:MAG: hypothetical protein ACQESG_01435 [Nanobdellota archaeon]